PVVGITPEDLIRAGIQRVPRVTNVSNGRPVLEDRRVLDASNVIWATGFARDYSWIKLPIFDSRGDPVHHRGVAAGRPGLYFVGLPYQSSLLSGLVAGAGLDAKYIAKQISVRARMINPAHGGKANSLSKKVSSTS